MKIDIGQRAVGVGDLISTRFGHRIIVESNETGKYGVMCPEGKVSNMIYDTLKELLEFYEPSEIINNKRLKLVTEY